MKVGDTTFKSPEKTTLLDTESQGPLKELNKRITKRGKVKRQDRNMLETISLKP